MRTGRPVRLALTLAQTFQAVRRTAYEVRMRTGFAADGTLVFQDVESFGLLGAYADIAVRVISKSTYLMCGPTAVPERACTSGGLLSHTPPATAFRGFGTPQVAWAVESQMDEAARRPGHRPAGDPAAQPRPPGRGGRAGGQARRRRLAAVAAQGRRRHRLGQPLPPGRGRGIGVAIKSSATTGASLLHRPAAHGRQRHRDGGHVGHGPGCPHVLSQIAAEELGLGVDAVQIVMGDTGMAPFDLQTSACRSTVFMGTAVAEACRDVKRQLADMAAGAYGVPAEEVDVGGVPPTSGERTVSFAELLGAASPACAARSSASAPGAARRTRATPSAERRPSTSSTATAVEVEVDRETGELLWSSTCPSADVGKALNPRTSRRRTRARRSWAWATR